MIVFKKEKNRMECVRCGEYLIDIEFGNIELPKLSENLQYPKDICIECVTDEEWKTLGISPEYVKKELQFLRRCQEGYNF